MRQSMAAGAHPDQGKRRSERQQRDSTRLGGKADRRNQETILSELTWQHDHADDPTDTVL